MAPPFHTSAALTKNQPLVLIISILRTDDPTRDLSQDLNFQREFEHLVFVNNYSFFSINPYLVWMPFVADSLMRAVETGAEGMTLCDMIRMCQNTTTTEVDLVLVCKVFKIIRYGTYRSV